MAAVFSHHLYDTAMTGGFIAAVEEGGVAEWSLQMLRMSVDAFFLLSGFLIPPCLVRQGSAWRFLVNRMTRIYPTFLVPHMCIFIVGPIIGYKWMAGIGLGPYLAHFFSNLLFLPGVFDLPIAQIVAWTLSYEIAFYLFASVALAISRGQMPLAARRLAWLTWAGAALCLLVWRPEAWFFVAGAAIWFLEEKRSGHVLATPSNGLFGLLAMLAMCLTYKSAYPVSLLCGSVGLLTLVRQQGILARLLQMRVLQYLADISYSFYLWHSMVMFATKRIFAYHGRLIPHTELNFVLFTFVSLVLSLLIAQTSYWLLEQRCTAWLQCRHSRLSWPRLTRAFG